MKQFAKIVAMLMVLTLVASMCVFAVSADVQNNDTTVVATADEVTTNDELATNDEIATGDEPATTPDEETTEDEVTTPEEFTPVYGDVDLNGKVDVRDATLIQKAIADLATLDEVQQAAAEVDANLTVNVKDATTIQKWIAGLIESAFIGKELGTVVIEPVTTPDEEPVTTPDEEPVTTPDEEPVTTPDEEPVTTPDEEPVTTPDEEPVTTPDEEPVTTPDEEEATQDQIPALDPNAIYVAFDNTNTAWDYVAFYQWTDTSFASYTVMTQIEGTDYWYLEVTDAVTAGLFKGTEDGVWADDMQTVDITVDTAANGNLIGYVATDLAGKWNVTVVTP